jgi:hypothetical protein
MWWHLGDLYAVAGSIWYPHLVEPALDVMERTLALDSPACQEGALHGLGHVQEYHPDRVAAIIDRHLPHLHVGLQEYAQSARTGRMV